MAEEIDRRAADLARYYDLDLAEDQGDVEFYLALAARHPGPILELAAGSGRICVALAAAGHDVTGVDNDGAMLERARAAWQAKAVAAGGGNLTTYLHDLTSLRLERRFSLVILGLNSLLLLPDRAAQTRALEVMAAHLAPDGRALLDVWLPAPEDLALYDGRLVLEWLRTNEEGGAWVAKTTSARYHSATARASVTTFFDEWRDGGPVERTMRSDEVTFVGQHELIALAEHAGLSVESISGDYEMNALEGNSEQVVLVARSA